MMGLYYLLPIVALIVVVLVSRAGQKHALARVQNMSPEEGRARINDFYGGSFELAPGEVLHVVYVGEEFRAGGSAGGQLAKAALNQLSAASIGMSTYVPQVRVGLASSGRVLVAREYTELGSRGNFKQIAAFAPGTRALGPDVAYPGQRIEAPMSTTTSNPEFVQFRAPSGESYDTWMSGGQTLGEGIVAAFEAQSRSAGAPG